MHDPLYNLFIKLYQFWIQFRETSFQLQDKHVIIPNEECTVLLSGRNVILNMCDFVKVAVQTKVHYDSLRC